ncbi:hypothetical protein JYK22_03810, partial [Nonomuraea sp. RK-328]|nr:hypothetical protein [Nonomuraea sp. RK-328]
VCPECLEIGGWCDEAVPVGNLPELVTCCFEGEAVRLAVLAQQQGAPSGALDCLHRILLRTLISGHVKAHV